MGSLLYVTTISCHFLLAHLSDNMNMAAGQTERLQNAILEHYRYVAPHIHG